MVNDYQNANICKDRRINGPGPEVRNQPAYRPPSYNECSKYGNGF